MILETIFVLFASLSVNLSEYSYFHFTSNFIDLGVCITSRYKRSCKQIYFQKHDKYKDF